MRGAPADATRTGQPAAARATATTKPSPPLLPGPQRTATGLADQRAITSRATAVPAFMHEILAGDACGLREAIGLLHLRDP